MAQQLPLPLPTRVATGRDDFVVSQANAMAVAMLDTWPNWPDGRLIIGGAKGAGKSHLVSVWQARSGARVIAARDVTEDAVLDLAQGPVALEDVSDPLTPETQRAVFHLYNLLAAQGQSLLMTGRGDVSRWPITLPDLASRLQSVTRAGMDAPDDALLEALLHKHFADRQLRVAPPVLAYILPRMERSFDGAQALVAALDATALEKGKGVTLAVARSVLDSLSPEA